MTDLNVFSPQLVQTVGQADHTNWAEPLLIFGTMGMAPLVAPTKAASPAKPQQGSAEPNQTQPS